ncbi:hypothetical protein U8527_10110 [Kordia algicida OT-1]|uniref:hypothetical protein n=1 Tax=Kordia algicida TaxID=221066 RepID=UPI003D9AC68A
MMYAFLAETGTAPTETDSLYVASRNGSSFMLDINDTDAGFGIMSNLLANGTLTEQGTALTLNSNLSLPIDIPGNAIDFEGLVLYDESIADGETLFSISDTYTQDIQGVPLTISYTLSTENISQLEGLTLNGETFTDVEVVDLLLEFSVSTSVDVLGNPTTFSILDPQNVLEIRSYYGANVGLIKADSEFSFELNPTTVALLQTLNIDLGFPNSINSGTSQEIKAYSVTN